MALALSNFDGELVIAVNSARTTVSVVSTAKRETIWEKNIPNARSIAAVELGPEHCVVVAEPAIEDCVHHVMAYSLRSYGSRGPLGTLRFTSPVFRVLVAVVLQTQVCVYPLTFDREAEVAAELVVDTGP